MYYMLRNVEDVNGHIRMIHLDVYIILSIRYAINLKLLR